MKVSGTIFKDFLGSKIGKILIVTAIAFIIVTFISKQLSVDNTCKRRAEELAKSLPKELIKNKAVLNAVKSQELERCLDESK